MRIFFSRFMIIDPKRENDFVCDLKLGSVTSRVGRDEKSKSRRLNHRGICKMEVGVVPQRWWLHRRGARWPRHDTDNELPRVAGDHPRRADSFSVISLAADCCDSSIRLSSGVRLRATLSLSYAIQAPADYVRTTLPTICEAGRDLTLIHAYPGMTADKKDPAGFFWRSEQRRRVPGEGNTVLTMFTRIT